MLTILIQKFRYFFIFFLAILLVIPAHAAGAPAPTIFDNAVAMVLILVMFLLLIVIAGLAHVLISVADMRVKENKKENSTSPALPLLIIFLALSVVPAHAQDIAPKTASVASTIGGLQTGVFYLMITVILLEFLVIVTIVIQIRILIEKKKQQKLLKELSAEEVLEAKRTRLSWWDKMNKFKPVSEEADLDLGHEYDGIRELNNRLPPWWLYGFYATIIFAFIYIYRFHISHSAPLSGEEYTQSVVEAESQIAAYLKEKGEAVDENTVTVLTAPDELNEGKTIFQNSCASCHLANGAGAVGPNLTDDYWLHGNDIKDVFKTIRYGINAMPQWQNSYSNKQIAQVASYVKSLHGSNPPNAKGPQGNEMKESETKAAVDSTKTSTANSITSR